MLLILLLRTFVGAMKSILALKTGQRIDAALILRYYKHLLTLPQQFFDTMRVGEIISRVNDAVKIRNFINNVSPLPAPCTANRISSSLMKRQARWTSKTKRSFTKPSSTCAPGSPSWSSPTVSPPSRAATPLSGWIKAGYAQPGPCRKCCRNMKPRCDKAERRRQRWMYEMIWRKICASHWFITGL